MIPNPLIVSNVGNTAGNTGMTYGTVVFQGSNNITLNQSTGSNGVITIHVSGQDTTAGLTNINISAGTTSNNLSKLTFADSNGISFGLNGSTLTATVQTNYLTTAMASDAATISNVRVSAGTTSNLLSAITFANSNGISFGLNASTLTATVRTDYLTTAMASDAATISNVRVSAGTTSNLLSAITFANSNGVSFGINASTITASVAAAGGNTISSYANVDQFVGTQTMSWNGASISHAIAFQLPQAISASFIRLPVLMTTGSTTIATTASSRNDAVSKVFTFNAVIYSLGVGANSKSLQSVASGSAGVTQRNSISIAANGTQYSVTQDFTYQVEGSQVTTSAGYSISNTNYSLVTTNWQSNYSSLRFLDINFANSLSAGPYWLIVGMSSSENTAFGLWPDPLSACRVVYSRHYGVSQANSYFGVMGSTNLSSGGHLGAGSFSTAGGGTTASLPLSAISSSGSNNQVYFQILRSA